MNVTGKMWVFLRIRAAYAVRKEHSMKKRAARIVSLIVRNVIMQRPVKYVRARISASDWTKSVWYVLRRNSMTKVLLSARIVPKIA